MSNWLGLYEEVRNLSDTELAELCEGGAEYIREHPGKWAQGKLADVWGNVCALGACFAQKEGIDYVINHGGKHELYWYADEITRRTDVHIPTRNDYLDTPMEAIDLLIDTSKKLRNL